MRITRFSHRLKRLLRGLLVAALLLATMLSAPYVGVRAFIEAARMFDGRSASPRAALERALDYGVFENGILPPPRGEFTIVQRHFLRHPWGLLYALRWQNDSGEDCVGLAFSEKIRDAFGGWKPRGSHWHCSRFAASARFSRSGQFGGYSLAYGLSGQAALVKVNWVGDDISYAQPIGGAYVSLPGRYGANASRVDFLDATGARIVSGRA